jgi:hypothetical protein
MVSTPPDNLALQLPADAYYHLVRTLCLALPPPLTDNPDDLARRNHAAITRIAALAPANAAEADLAAMYVAASEQWKECLRLAQLPETPLATVLKRRAEAGSMMREARSALQLLLRLQEARPERDSDNHAAPPRGLDRTSAATTDSGSTAVARPRRNTWPTSEIIAFRPAKPH